MVVRQLKVLIVEDELELQTSISRILRHLERDIEADVEWTSSAEKASNFISENHYDLIIVDHNLPGRLTGFDFWRKAVKKSDAAFVLMSGISIPEYLGLIGENRNVPLFLRKPFTVDEFKSVVAAAMDSENRNSQAGGSI